MPRTFTASAPGTYLYQSVGDGERQTAMGLYGALIVRLARPPGRPTGRAASAFDVEATLVLSAIDPAFNADPDGFDMRGYCATYWLINGKAYPQTGRDPRRGRPDGCCSATSTPGFDNTTMMLLGTHEHVIAVMPTCCEPIRRRRGDDPGRRRPRTRSRPCRPALRAANGFPLYNRQLHLTNGAPGARYSARRDDDVHPGAVNVTAGSARAARRGPPASASSAWHRRRRASPSRWRWLAALAHAPFVGSRAQA